MQKKYKACMVLAMLCLLFLFPQDAFSADKGKAKEKEYNFNENKTIAVSEKESYAESGKYTWLKYKPAADGYLTVEALDSGEPDQKAKGYLALYDNTKTKLLSSGTIFYNTANRDSSYWYKFIFGLKKDTVYYIRVKSENAVEFTRKFTKVKNAAGISRVKARKLNKNKTRTGLIPAGVSSVDWYQINLTKKQKLRLYYNVRTNGCFKLSVYMGKKLYATRNIYHTSGQKLTLCLDVNGKQRGMNAGEYFVKIERANTVSSGYYKIKWN